MKTQKVIGHDLAKQQLIMNSSIQSWLICGEKGIGKTTLIKHFSAFSLTKGYNKITFDLHIVEGSTIGIEKIKGIKNFLHLKPIQSEHKIAIIDSLEAMTNNAKNAILKILEEPPKNSKIFIISHKPYNIERTIKCRCFQLDLFPLTYDETKLVVSSQCDFNNQVFNEIINFFPGKPGIIINAINSNAYTSYKYLYKVLENPQNYKALNEVINSEIKLELASHIIQTFILNKIKKKVNKIETLLRSWKKIDELFVTALKLKLDEKCVLVNAINIITSINQT